jgi:hypothetical protein
VSISNLALRSARRPGDALACCKATTESSTAKFTELRPVTPLSLSPLGNQKELSTTSLSIREEAHQYLRAKMHDKHEMIRTAHWTSAIAHVHLRIMIDIKV